MGSAHPVEPGTDRTQLPADSHLRGVLTLGKSLFSIALRLTNTDTPVQDILEQQRQQILEAAARMLGGQSRLWLAIDLQHPYAGKSSRLELPAEQLSAQMATCLQTGHLVKAEDGKLAAAPLNGISDDGQPATPLGVLQIERSSVPMLSSNDFELLEALATQAGLGLQSSLRIIDERWRTQQLEAVYAVSSAITSILNQEELLNEVVHLIQSRFGYPWAHVYSVHPGRRKVFYEAGTLGKAFKAAEFAFELDDAPGLIPWAARNGSTVLVNDVTLDDRYRPNEIGPDQTLSELCVPLVFGGEVLGVLDIQSDQRNAFGEDDRYLFEALADHVAIALRNAVLYRSELWRRQVAESMREVAGLLTADADLDTVLQAILTELQRALPMDMAAIWLVDDDYSRRVDQRPPLHLAAVSGDGIADLELELGLTPEEVWEYNTPADHNLVDFHPDNWLQEALVSETAITRESAMTYDPMAAALSFPTNYSALAAPLRVGEELLGVMVLFTHSSGRYGSEARQMSAAFASYAAVAIENTRMYEAAHEQAWVSTVLLQVAEATQSLTNLNELLTTVMRITPMLAGVRACLLYIMDDDGDFVPAACSVLTAEQQAEFERWRFAPGDVAALDRLVAEHHPIILQGDDDDRSLTRILESGEGHDGKSEPGLAVLVPMIARGEVLGAFVVDYKAEAAGITGKSLEAFLDERLAILQGIAHQTAVAVDNARLLKTQKEDAYVSVALLQVAQAVVSSNDLDEALGSIVRITPILVGVKRALIYLWNDAHRYFRMSQSYGTPRQAEGQTLSLGQFPLLDAVLLEDVLTAYPLWDELSAAENVPEAWMSLDPPDVETVEEYLENAACLLMAFPLSVKGKVLGVLLVEEPDSVVVEGFTSSAANRRLRGKRMEIITGISQQAALAIQNDQLQREMVEQERLEREMQLAREIQTAFLPQEIPDLPGWEVQVLWRTAREVGGDFYDYFELPGNRLGVVIADVADKGMPAALFMTLVRTLLRASVPETDSPAEVLRRVNEIILPDAPRGMFVTLMYAVLDLDTGQLEYANAGHNPPLLLRTGNCTLEHLERTGMALGVEENTPIHERKVAIQAGDMLVLYTDGVTEAFSPDGEPFGEERLQDVILSLGRDALVRGSLLAESADRDVPGEIPTPAALKPLERVEQSVQAFTGPVDLSDDLTMVMIWRAL